MQLSLKNVLFELFWLISFFWVYGSLINIYFSILDAKYNIDVYYSIINDGPRLSIAILLVVFPIFIIMSIFRRKYLLSNPDLNGDTKSRHAIYLINFVLVFTFVSTFITVVYKFLGGEFTTLFLLKCLVIFIITAVSALYFYAINKEVGYRKIVVSAAAVLSSILVVSAMIFYVKVFGTPEYMRNIRQDEETVNKISSVRYTINNYFSQKKSLPKDLSFITTDHEGITYTVIDLENYQLCADFKEEKNIDSKNYFDFNSNHPKGNFCYKFNSFNY
jgi:hypothetical protein